MWETISWFYQEATQVWQPNWIGQCVFFRLTIKIRSPNKNRVNEHTKQWFKRLVIPKAPPSLPRTTPMRISANLTSLSTLRAVDSHSLQTWEDHVEEAVVKIKLPDWYIDHGSNALLENIMPSEIYLSILFNLTKFYWNWIMHNRWW